MGEEGLEDVRVPTGDDAKEEAREELGGQDCCQHWQSLFGMEPESKWRGQREPFSNQREKAGNKDEQEPFGKMNENK